MVSSEKSFGVYSSSKVKGVSLSDTTCSIDSTSNKLSCNHIMKDWNVDSRDDLIKWVNRFKKDKKTRTYSENERAECLNYYVNDHDNQLLSRYCKSILELKKRGQ